MRRRLMCVPRLVGRDSGTFTSSRSSFGAALLGDRGRGEETLSSNTRSNTRMEDDRITLTQKRERARDAGNNLVTRETHSGNGR